MQSPQHAGTHTHKFNDVAVGSKITELLELRGSFSQILIAEVFFFCCFFFPPFDFGFHFLKQEHLLEHASRHIAKKGTPEYKNMMSIAVRP